MSLVAQVGCSRSVLTLHAWLLCQILGVLAIFATSFTTMLAVAYSLKWYEILRVTPEEESRGLDHKFGMAASAFHYNKAQRLRSCAAVVEANGHSISQLIEALQNLKNHILMPFSPQASDLVIEGQVTDIVSRLDIGFEDVRSAAAPHHIQPPPEQAAHHPSRPAGYRSRGVSMERCVCYKFVSYGPSVKFCMM